MHQYSTLSLSWVVWFMVQSSSAEYSTSFVSSLEGVEVYRSSSKSSSLLSLLKSSEFFFPLEIFWFGGQQSKFNLC